MGAYPVYGPFNEKAYIEEKQRRTREQDLKENLAKLEKAEARNDRDEQERLWQLICLSARGA